MVNMGLLSGNCRTNLTTAGADSGLSASVNSSVFNVLCDGECGVVMKLRRGYQPCPKAGGGKGPCGYASRRPGNIESCPICHPGAAVAKAGDLGTDSGTVGLSGPSLSRSEVSDAYVNDDTGGLDFSSLKKGDRTKAMQEELINGMENLTVDPEEMDRYLAFAASAYSYSAQNTMLLYLQRPEGYNFHTYKQWAAQGYQVKKGSKSASVLRPMLRDVPVSEAWGWYPGSKEQTTKNKKGEDCVRRVVGYSAYSVFPANDLDPDVKAAPSNPFVKDYDAYRSTDVDDNERLKSDLLGLAEQMDINVKYMSVDDPEWSASRDAGGYATIIGSRKCIVVNTDYAPASQTYTLAHEMGHVACGHLDASTKDKTRDEREVEAESVAYTLARTYGLDPEKRAFAYLKSWTGGDGAKVKKSMTAVQKGLGVVFGGLEKMRTGTNQTEEREEAAAKSKAEWESNRAERSGKGKGRSRKK